MKTKLNFSEGKKIIVAVCWMFPTIVAGQVVPYQKNITFIRAYNDSFIIHAAKKLEWKDFHGVPPHQEVLRGRKADTTTSTVISYSCDTFGDSAAYFNFSVRAVFAKSRSWSIIPSQDGLLLAHEQLHFDIAELYARKVRKLFVDFAEELKNGTRTCTYLAELLKTAEELRIKGNELNSQYDNETNHGGIVQKQKEWEEKINQELKIYEEYKTDHLDFMISRGR